MTPLKTSKQRWVPIQTTRGKSSILFLLVITPLNIFSCSFSAIKNMLLDIARQLLLQAYDTLSLVKEKYEGKCLEIYLLCFLSIIKLSKFHCVMKVFLIWRSPQALSTYHNLAIK